MLGLFGMEKIEKIELSWIGYNEITTLFDFYNAWLFWLCRFFKTSNINTNWERY